MIIYPMVYMGKIIGSDRDAEIEGLTQRKALLNNHYKFIMPTG
jgi:hypothetical protein